MSEDHGATSDQGILLENLAAELTSVAYSLALRHGLRGSWIEVELGLWTALTETVKKWVREWPLPGSLDEFTAWREGLLVDLTQGAFSIAVQHGINGSLPEVELGLYKALRSVIKRVGQEALRRQITKVRYS